MYQSEEREINGFTLKIYRDESSESPRDWDNVGTIAYKHRGYALGEEEISDPIDWLASLLGLEEEQVSRIADKNGVSYYSDEVKGILEDRFLNSKDYVALPIYMYDHGGVTINTTGFSCRWDSGQVGYIYCTKERAVEEWGKKVCTKQVRERALNYLRYEVEVFDQYLTGEVYGYELCKGDEVIDSCWGFYGDDHEESGLLDSARGCIPEVKRIREYGDLVRCELDGGKIKKIFAYDVTESYRSVFEIVEDAATGDVEFKVLCDEEV